MTVTETASSNKTRQEHIPGREWPAWHTTLSNYRDPSIYKTSWQLMNTILPYFCLWFLMILSIQRGYPYALTLALAVVAAASLVRIFILFHDCVHGSLFQWKGANTLFGYFFGVLLFTPFEDWRFSHLRHHASYANLDARGYGDIWTMTLTEYEDSPKWKKNFYRFYRNPLVLFGLGALFSFLLRYRLPTRKATRKEHMSALFTNLLIAGVVLISARSIGWRTYLLIQLPVIWIAGAAGVWLFYVQHQFKGVYWARKQEWDALRAAMEGSSFYRLPPVLRWFSGSIGYHHVHHLGPRIPNYRLKDCYDAVPALQARPPLTIRESLSTIPLKIWDEEHRELVRFRIQETGSGK
jgi:omega-6 fatty acid desaturase (delta-12 desaturase)